jgi:hypothetical protein
VTFACNQGRLKEQDDLIDLIQHLILDSSDGLVTFSVEEAFEMVERMIADHVVRPENSRLKKYEGLLLHSLFSRVVTPVFVQVLPALGCHPHATPAQAGFG